MATIPKKVVTFVIGSACAGKSTLSGYLSRKGHGITFRASACLEDYITTNFKGKTLSDFIGDDYLAHIPQVDDARLLCRGIIDSVNKNERVIIDGYPRSLHQLFTMQEFMEQIESRGHIIRVVNLIVPIPELLRRMFNRGRDGDTEARILSEVSIHTEIANHLRQMAEKNKNMTYVEFIIPNNADDTMIKRDFTPGLTGKLQEISFMDSIGRRFNTIFSDIEYKRHEGFSDKSNNTVYL